MEEKSVAYSIIIPVYNEASIIHRVVSELDDVLRSILPGAYEIIAVDDSSRDESAAILRQLTSERVHLVTHTVNKGYGAALKTGAAHARGTWLVFFDGDGQHNPADVGKLIAKAENSDMVVGARTHYRGPRWRQPGKTLLTLLANYLVRFRIPDLNSGLRLVRAEAFHVFVHLYPQGFSLSTTITLAFIKHGFNVTYVPINVAHRVGKSSLKLRDGITALGLITRMIMLFAPLRVFIPVSGVLLLCGVMILGLDIFVHNNIGDTSILLLVSSLIIFFFGLLADQIAALRREFKFK